MAKKYDIIIHDEDPNVKPEKQNGLVAESPQVLFSMFKQCGQNVEIVREYEDDESRNYGKSKRQPVPENFKPVNGDVVDITSTVPTHQNIPQVQTVPQQYIKKSEPPRYFEIGGIKCKMENGKMYQKQWMRLSDNEAQEFRLVSDANNKICSTNGKHIEVMKWVLVEDEKDSLVDSNENKGLELLNG